MAIPSRILGAGNSPLSTVSIAGDGAVGIVALGSTAADAKLLSAVFNTITTSSASTGVKLPPTEAGAMITIQAQLSMQQPHLLHWQQQRA